MIGYIKNFFIFLKRLFTRSGVDRWIYIAVAILAITGIAMVGSASVGLASKFGSTYATMTMIKQGIFILIGSISMIFFARTFKARYANENSVWILYFIALAAMILCLAWTDTKGSNSWIKLPGGFTIQPIEFMKIVMILLLSVHFGGLTEELVISNSVSKKVREKRTNQKMIICFFLPVIAILVAFIVGGFIQKDLGSSLILAFICLFIFYCTPLKYYSKLKILSIAVIGLVLAVFAFTAAFVLQSHQLTRFLIWLNPTSSDYYYSSSFQLANGLVAYATGGLFGKGYGSSIMKFGYVQEASNDFISAIIVEELGVVGFFILIIIPYCIIIFRLFYYGQKIKNTQEKLILYGIGIYFFAHLLINVGGVSGLIPMTGVPLLIVSSGGSSVIASMTAIGIAQSLIAKYSKDKLKEQL